MVRSRGNMSLKSPVTPPGIDPGTVRLLAQHLNHYATPGPLIELYGEKEINVIDETVHDMIYYLFKEQPHG